MTCDVVLDSSILAAGGIQQDLGAGLSCIQPICNACVNSIQIIATSAVSASLKLLQTQKRVNHNNTIPLTSM